MTRRVALVLGNLGIGGAERQALELARRLPALGWEPVLFVAEDIGEMRDAVRGEGLRVVPLGARHALPKSDPRFWLNVAGVIARMARGFARERITIVHSFLFWENVLAVPAARLAPGVRAVITGRRNTGAYKDGRPHYQLIESTTNLLTDAVVCNARDVLRDARRRESFLPARTLVIPNGVDAARFAAALPIDVTAHAPVLAGAEPLTGMIASLKPAKRPDVFLRAVALARRTHPGLKVFLAGPDRGWGARVERLIGELGLRGAVACVGPVDDPGRWIAAADFLVLTSDEEGMPNAALESLAAGRALIATDVSGSREIVRDGVTGLLVPRRDPDSVARAIIRLADDPALRARLAARGQRLVAKRYTLERMAERTAELYQQLAR